VWSRVRCELYWLAEDEDALYGSVTSGAMNSMDDTQ